jgi:hypothetical protein
MQGVYFRSHARSTNQRVEISQRLPIDVPNNLLYFLHVQHCVQISQGLPIDVPNHLLHFLHAQPRIQKARGYRSTLHTTSTTFSARIATYKKQRAP